MVTNVEFLQAMFGEEYLCAHVTSFVDDPSAIPQDRMGICWHGHHFQDRKLKGGNQYYCVSLFDDFITEGGATQHKRKKSLFKGIYVICLDDVKEKLDVNEAQRLPTPSFILETSHGSEQWGYLLKEPCRNMRHADNLLDGLVAKGLAPDGKDPGMKGVTRYVRLPEGINTKRKKLVFGKPFNCRMLSWKPELRYTMKQIASPFEIDLDSERREVKLTGAVDNDHPILKKLHIKEKLGPGQYDITCPWVDQHTEQSDSGTAVFTNEDGTLGFKCHHGHCENRTAVDLITHFDCGQEINRWKMEDSFEKKKSIDQKLAEFEYTVPGKEKNILAHDIMVEAQTLDEISKVEVHKRVRSEMDWTVAELKKIIKSIKNQKRGKGDETEFYDHFVFVGEQNKFYDADKNIWYTAEAFSNYLLHFDVEVKKQALAGKVTKVDKVDYYPEMPTFFDEDGIRYVNIWQKRDLQVTPGDCSRWLDHFDRLGWDKDHMIKWMAYTIRHPREKINHAIIMGSGEGSGKDWLLTPLKMAMGRDHRTIDGNMLVDQFNTYLVGTKYLHINEVEHGEGGGSMMISNKIKPLTAAPPHTLSVNEKNVKNYDVRNIVNVTMTTNSRMPLRLRDMSRRIYALWSDFSIRDENNEVIPAWLDWWQDSWDWMLDGGWEHCVDYLMKVDISDFNPGAAPPVTDWLRDIVRNSENKITQTLNALIAAKFGAFKMDRPTDQELIGSVNMARRTNSELVFCDKITPSTLDLNLKNMGYRREGPHWVMNNDGITKQDMPLRSI